MLTVARDTRIEAARTGFGRLDATLQRELRDTAAEWIVPLVMRSVRSHASTRLQANVADTGRYSVFRDVPGIAFGTSTAVTADGVPGRTLARSAEYGSDGTRVETFRQRSRKGNPYSVTRHTTRQFMPRTPAGAFVAAGALAVHDAVLDEWVTIVEEAGASAWNGEG